MASLNKTTIGWVKEIDDKFVGIVLGLVSGSFWDTQTVGKIIVWYVDPEYRGIVAVRLMQLLLYWFRHKEVDFVTANCDFGSDAARAYRKLGFKPLEETLYLVEV